MHVCHSLRHPSPHLSLSHHTHSYLALPSLISTHTVPLTHSWPLLVTSPPPPLQSGFDVNGTLMNGRNALHYAADYGQVAVVDLLLEQKANINVSHALSHSTYFCSISVPPLSCPTHSHLFHTPPTFVPSLYLLSQVPLTPISVPPLSSPTHSHLCTSSLKSHSLPSLYLLSQVPLTPISVPPLSCPTHSHLFHTPLSASSVYFLPHYPSSVPLTPFIHLLLSHLFHLSLLLFSPLPTSFSHPLSPSSRPLSSPPPIHSLHHPLLTLSNTLSPLHPSTLSIVPSSCINLLSKHIILPPYSPYPQTPDKFGITPLLAAIYEGHVEVVKLLLKKVQYLYNVYRNTHAQWA